MSSQILHSFLVDVLLSLLLEERRLDISDVSILRYTSYAIISIDSHYKYLPMTSLINVIIICGQITSFFR